jgi:hypothetical protein
MISGAAIDVWADACEGLGGPDDARDYTFTNLFNVDPVDMDAWPVNAIAPNNPVLVDVLVARFPRDAVSRVYSALKS